ncbi:hypothetical protein K0M31_007407 [Melipona bicolor]|uniref:Uncharacterized protein n=1 Tax=Melipona bicolor TaxID=60889 RepID=A0AA40KVN2_9HYME|nr:hypothetical protein K0M31_007407 [Melipona bicolor]
MARLNEGGHGMGWNGRKEADLLRNLRSFSVVEGVVAWRCTSILEMRPRRLQRGGLQRGKLVFSFGRAFKLSDGDVTVIKRLDLRVE